MCKRVFPDQFPVLVDMLGSSEIPVLEPVQGLFHRVERVTFAGEDGIFSKFMADLRHGI